MVFEGCVDHWPALTQWTHSYLKARAGDEHVHVALTPDGLGDAVKRMEANQLHVFAKPQEKRMPFRDFIDSIEKPRRNAAGTPTRPVFYCSHQNSSLVHEFKVICDEADSSLDWADVAFGAKPIASNFWMGEDEAVTTVHNDVYENLYVVVRGSKQFRLLPPHELHHLQREAFRAATYVNGARSPERSGEEGRDPELDGSKLILQLDDDSSTVVWSPVDLCTCEAVRPLFVELRPGDLLYLPAHWWHEVRQNQRQHESTIAVNYWYDSGVGPMFSQQLFLEKMASMVHGTKA